MGIIVVLLVFISVVGSLGGGGGGEESAKGGADQEHNKSTSGGTASTNFQTGQEHKKNVSSGTAPTNLQMDATGGSAATNGQITFGRHQPTELFRDQSLSAIFAMNPDGSHVSQITHPPEGFRDDGPEWSADGQRLAFYRQRIDEKEHQLGMSRIMVLNTETGDPRQVEGAEGFDPAFSPDGHSLAFKGILGPDIYAIWIVGLDGSTLHQVTNVDPKLPVAFSDSWPQFSPDGKELVFERTRLEDDHTAVFVQSIDSSGSPVDAHQLTPWKMDCGITPEFSPDGKLVLFRCGPWLEAGSMLWWVHPDGTGLHRLDKTIMEGSPVRSYLGSGFSPSFSGGEGWITTTWLPDTYGEYASEDRADVFRMRIEDGDVVRTTNLTKSEMDESAPDWGTHQPVG
jgi:Tol biopolymer transport system component